MEHRETEEMHEAVDQILRSALIAVGSVQQRLARRQQVAADQARMVAAASRTETDAYTAAQDTMLRQSLRNAIDPRWFDTSTPAERVATRDMADRFAEVSPYAKAVLDHIDTEAARRGETLTPPETGGPEPTHTTGVTDLGKTETATAATETATPPRPVARRSYLRNLPAATYDKARAADSATAQTRQAAYQTGATANHKAPGTLPGHPQSDPAALDTTATSYYASESEPTAEQKQGADATAERPARAASPTPGFTHDTSPTEGPATAEPAATTQPEHSPAAGPARRRPVAVDTTATEQEVADRLSASRSFPRPIWDQLRTNPGATLRPGSPTTLPRGRDKGLGL